MPTSPRLALPYPAGTANNDVPADFAALAARLDTVITGAFTTAARDALVGAEVWLGRVIFNSTTNSLNLYTATGWIDVPSVAAAFTAAGQLLVGSGAGAFSTLALGAAKRLLRVNAAGNGLEYIAFPDVPMDREWTIGGDVAVAAGDTNFVVPMELPAPVAGWQRWISLARHRINAGTSATVKLQAGGVDVTGFTAISVTQTRTTTNPADVQLADDVDLSLVVTAITGGPKNLGFAISGYYRYTG